MNKKTMPGVPTIGKRTCPVPKVKFSPVLMAMMLAVPALAMSSAAVSSPSFAGSPGEQNGAAQAQAQSVIVDVMTHDGENLRFEFDERVRLRQVLESTAAQLGSDIHWPTARLVHRNGNARVQRKQQTILAELQSLQQHWQAKGDEARAKTVANLAEQVQRWQLGYQVVANIDLAAARQRLESNPLLAAGEHVLLIGERPTTSYIYGAVSSQQFAIAPGQSLRNYIVETEHRSSTAFERDGRQALVVRGDGVFEDVPWGMHNATAYELAAGDIVWVKPAKKVFTKDYEHLAEDIPALLQHWVSDAQPLEPMSFGAEEPVVPHWQQFDLSPRRNHYGGVGLMQTPTARMAPEGEAIVMYADTDEYRRYTVSMQVLPWLQASAFYTRIPNRLYSSRPDFSGTNILTDKGFDVKFRLWQEREWLPEVSVGLSDFAGTGLFDGEYIVASKRYGAFDFTLGLGFGRHGASGNVSNPFCEITDRFCERPSETVGTGSQLDFDRYFSGPAGVFGGIEYQTPWEPLRLMVEYDANDYSRDSAGVDIDPGSAWNFGASYRVTDWFDAAVSYERGDALMFNFVLRTNLSTLSQLRVDQPRVEPRETPEVAAVDDVDWNQLAHRLSNNRTIAGPRFNMPDDQTVRVEGHPWRYRDNNEAIDRSARILADTLPETITTYEFESLTAFQPMSLTTVDAEAFKRRIRNEEPGKAIDETEELFARSSPEFDYEPQAWLYDFPRSRRIGFGFKPFFEQDFGSPETFHFYQLGVKGFAQGWVANDLHAFGEIGVNLLNNYDKFLFERDPFDLPLPRVRSDFRLHATNDVWIDRLQLTYFKRLSDNLYGMAYGGYLERYFSGVGGEVLYREVDSPWAFGVNINRVRQRDFEGWLGHESYETTMGHASIYYQMPWLKDSLLRLDVGRFLAGDDGVGVTFARRFDSGVIVSAYASFTNVSSEDYGEGSFTHGFSISVPFDLIGIRPTRERLGMSWSPMSRDGGQPLWRQFDLHGMTDERNPFWSR